MLLRSNFRKASLEKSPLTGSQDMETIIEEKNVTFDNNILIIDITFSKNVSLSKERLKSSMRKVNFVNQDWEWKEPLEEIIDQERDADDKRNMKIKFYLQKIKRRIKLFVL